MTNKGTPRSEKTREKISLAMTGKTIKRVPYYEKGWRWCTRCQVYISPEELPTVSYRAGNGSLRHRPLNRPCGQQVRSRPSNMRLARSKGHYN
jgi:hypothetical protein